MKISKLVSVLSALTITAGAFAGLAVTANAAEGDVSTLADIDFSNAISDGSVAGTAGSMTVTGSYDINSDGRLRLYNGTGTVDLSGTTFNSTDKVEFAFDLGFGKLGGKTVTLQIMGKDSSSNSVKLAEVVFDVYYGDFNDTNTLNLSWDSMYRGYDTVLWERCVNFDIVMDYAAGTITTSTACYKSGTGKDQTTATYTAKISDKSIAPTSFVISSNYDNTDRLCQFDNLKITRTEGAAVSSYGYTINYTLDGETVYTAKGTANAGDKITPDSRVTAEDGTIYCADTTPETVEINYKTTLEIPVHKAAAYTCKVVTTQGTELVAETSVTEGDTFSYAIPMYVTDSTGKVTETVTADTYMDTITPTADTTITVTGTAYDGTAYFAEGETYDNNAVTAGGTYSGGKYGAMPKTNNVADQTKVFTLPSGVYTVAVKYYDDGSSHGNRGFYLRDSSDTDNSTNTITTVEIERSASSGTYTGTMTLTAETGINITGYTDEARTQQSVFFDYVLITRTGNAPTSATINADYLGVYEGTDGSTATAFTAALTGSTTSSKITDIAVTSNGTTKTAASGALGDFAETTLTNADAVIGIIVSGLSDTAATATVTFE